MTIYPRFLETKVLKSENEYHLSLTPGCWCVFVTSREPATAPRHQPRFLTVTTLCLLPINCIKFSSSPMQRTRFFTRGWEREFRNHWHDSAREVKKAQEHMYYTPLPHWHSELLTYVQHQFYLSTKHFLKSPLSLFNLPSDELATSSALLSPTLHNPGLLRNRKFRFWNPRFLIYVYAV